MVVECPVGGDRHITATAREVIMEGTSKLKSVDDTKGLSISCGCVLRTKRPTKVGKERSTWYRKVINMYCNPPVNEKGTSFVELSHKNDSW